MPGEARTLHAALAHQRHDALAPPAGRRVPLDESYGDAVGLANPVVDHASGVADRHSPAVERPGRDAHALLARHAKLHRTQHVFRDHRPAEQGDTALPPVSYTHLRAHETPDHLV